MHANPIPFPSSMVFHNINNSYTFLPYGDISNCILTCNQQKPKPIF